MRNVIIVLGDQLTHQLTALEGFDKSQDVVWMAEVSGESEKVWCSRQRIALFLAAMRHFAEELKANGAVLHYQKLEDEGENRTLGAALSQFLEDNHPDQVILTRPGEYWVLEEIKEACHRLSVQIEVREDETFLCTVEEFEKHAKGRKQLRMEYFYREMRRKYSVLMDGSQPAGGAWNFDKSNRKSFGKSGPGRSFSRARFSPGTITRQVIRLVNERFPNHMGSLEDFSWPIDRAQSLAALDDFIKNQLATFGPHQDAMWSNEAFLSHSLLSASLNLKLLHPIEVIKAAETAYLNGIAPIESAEGFIRQILGWREYVRGIYWMQMPEYRELNYLDATNPLPDFFWTGKTDMECLRAVVEQTFKHGYAHHIQRLMVTGLYALLAGVNPKEIHEWYLSVYVDAVEWVELPNTLGMSQYADGGIMSSKPYAATGKYIQRMSNYCDSCRYDPSLRSGKNACPFTVLYWDFLARNAIRLSDNHRMRMQLKNLHNLAAGELNEIRRQASKLIAG
jgi:deoxyribodipyrimidine photolyase-related protein